MNSNPSDREHPTRQDPADHRTGRMNSSAEEDLCLNEDPPVESVAEDSEFSECVRFIERVQLETPHCLADFDLGSGVENNDIDGLSTYAEMVDQLAVGQWPSFPQQPHDADSAQIGRFQILGKLGEGGFGLVLLAYDPELARQVALKIPRVESLFTEDLRKRFLQEGKAVARLNHRNIAPVYEAGQFGPVCYIVSAYCSGGSLADLLKVQLDRSAKNEDVGQNKFPKVMGFSSAASLIKSLADAIQHAHERGFIHRDLKPSNILFDVDSNEQESGNDAKFGQKWIPRKTDPSGEHDLGPAEWAQTARVVDFGLAKSLNADEHRTQTGAALGTPSYMSPEQADGDPNRIGPPTDVYSLGAILYELLTGRPPFKGPSHVATVIAVKNEYPIAPRKLNVDCPKDLEAICLMCLEKDPPRRYSSASELADDLQRFLRGAPIQARTPSPIGRLLRWCRRNPTAAMFTALVLAFAIAGPIVALNQRRLYRQAEQARQDSRRTLYISDMNLALRDWQEANVERCGELLKRHIPVTGGQDYRGFEWYYLWRHWQESASVPVVLHVDNLEAMAVSPDENMVAIGTNDGTVLLCDRKTGRTLAQWQAHPYHTFCLEFSFDGKLLASASIDNEVKIWDVATKREIAKLSGSRALAFSPVDRTLAYRTDHRSIAIIEDGESHPRVFAEAHEFGVGCVEFSPDGRSLASGGWDGRVRIWDVATGSREADMSGSSAIWALDWSRDGKHVATGDVYGTITLRDGSTAAPIRTVRGHRSTIRSLSFSADSSSLATASDDNMIKLWRVSTLEEWKSLRGHYGMVTSVAFAESDNRLLSSSIDGDVKSWKIPNVPYGDVLMHPDAALSVSFSGDGKLIATGCADGYVRLWNAATGEPFFKLNAHAGGVWRVQFLTYNGQDALISSGADGALRLWDVASRDIIRKFPCPAGVGNPIPVTVSYDHSRLAFPDSEISVTVWDLIRDKPINKWTVGNPADLQLSPDGQTIAIALIDTIEIRELYNNAVRQTLQESRNIKSVAFAPDGKTLASGSYDRTVKLWNLEKNSIRLCRVLKGPASPVLTTAFSSDGTVLASAGDDNVIRLWDPETGDQCGVLAGHSATVCHLQFSADTELLASASHDFTVRIWRAPIIDR